MRIEQTATTCATEQSSGCHRIRVCKGVLGRVLSLNWSSATFAVKLSVEGIKRLSLWVELIGVSLDGFPSQKRIHLDYRHASSVEQVG